MRKAKNAPPWTRKKLHRYRTEQRTMREEERERDKAAAKELQKSGRFYDIAMEGCRERTGV